MGHARDVALLDRIEVDGEKNDGKRTRGCPRRQQRRFVAPREQQVHTAPGQLAVGLIVAFDAWRLDKLEGEITALHVAKLGHPLLESGIMRGSSREHSRVAD